MGKRKYTHIQALAPAMVEVRAAGMSRREIADELGRTLKSYDNVMAENFFSIIKTEYIYRRKQKTFQEANDLIDRYIHFYNYERIQLKTGETPLAPRLSA